MHRAARLALLFLPLVSCTQREERATDTSVAAAPGNRSGAAPPGADSVAIADSTCTGVAALVSSALKTRLDRDPASRFAAPGDGGSWVGCRFTAQLTVPSGDARTPSQRVADALRADGWRADDRWLADGAADTQEGYVRGDALCHFSYVTPADAVEPDAPADAPPPPSIAYSIEIRCTSPVPPRPS
ncbi:MAG TPA: hypothetical protein VFV33_15000 [Gemmatimonadaceae bacterium]|nr:hypothetical protein [Gemmatimonadaceae bacterium]